MSPGSVGETLIAAVIFAVALSAMWVSSGRDGGSDELASLFAAPAAEGNEESVIPPSQPAVAASFTASGQIVRPAPETVRIVDPETGEDVVVPLPPGATVVDGQVVPPGGTPPAGPGGTPSTTSGTTGTTGGGSSTTSSPTTAPPTTEPPTTEPPTTAPPTTEPPTTEPPTTEPPTTTPPTTEPPPAAQGVGGLLDDVGDLLGL